MPLHDVYRPLWWPSKGRRHGVLHGECTRLGDAEGDTWTCAECGAMGPTAAVQ